MDAAFGEQGGDVGIRDAQPQVPAHGEGDHIIGKLEATEGRGGARREAVAAGAAAVLLPAGAILARLGELLAPTLIALHRALPVHHHQGGAYGRSARPNSTLQSTDVARPSPCEQMCFSARTGTATLTGRAADAHSRGTPHARVPP